MANGKWQSPREFQMPNSKWQMPCNRNLPFDICHLAFDYDKVCSISL